MFNNLSSLGELTLHSPNPRPYNLASWCMTLSTKIASCFKIILLILIGSYFMSRAYENETDDVCVTQKENNENQTICKCTDCLSMNSDFYTGSTRLLFYFSFQITKLHKPQKFSKNTKNSYVHLMKITNGMQILRC